MRPAPRVCEYCGQHLLEPARFCSGCGKPLATQPATDQAVQVPPIQAFTVRIGGRERGPLTRARLQLLWDTGELTKRSECRALDGGAWRPVIEVLYPERSPSGDSQVPEKGRTIALAYDPITARFRGSLTALVKLATRALRECEYMTTGANTELGLVNFYTGSAGGAGTLSLVEAGDDHYRVSIVAEQSEIDFGGAEYRAKMIFDRMRAALR